MPGSQADIEQRIQDAAAELHPHSRPAPAASSVLRPGLPARHCPFPLTLSTIPMDQKDVTPACDYAGRAGRRRL